MHVQSNMEVGLIICEAPVFMHERGVTPASQADQLLQQLLHQCGCLLWSDHDLTEGKLAIDSCKADAWRSLSDTVDLVKFGVNHSPATLMGVLGEVQL